jgi:3-hydroxybutyryl-CoA dehydrogenase
MAKVFVVGAGFMGAGIAQVCASYGHDVWLNDANPDTLTKGIEGIQWSLDKLASKGYLPMEPDTVMARLHPANDLSPASDADWIIEAVVEKEDLKKQLFRELDKLALPGTPICSNTSSIPITRLASVVNRPERVLGLHFFGPVPFMGVVEVVKGEKTSDDIFQRGVEFVQELGKTPVRVRRDIPLFVMNRIFSAAFNEAINLVAEGVASVEDVDVGMRQGYGWAAGPFEVADNAGVDVYDMVFTVMQNVGETRLSSGPGMDIIKDMVAEGRLGRKTGKGFYDYTPDGKRVPKAE